MKPEEIWSIWNEVVDVDMGFDPVPFANAIIDAVPTIGLERIAQVLACEIECGIFEQHVAPALDIARKALLAPTQGADARPVAIRPTGDQLRAIIKGVGGFGTNHDDAPTAYVLAGWNAALATCDAEASVPDEMAVIRLKRLCRALDVPMDDRLIADPEARFAIYGQLCWVAEQWKRDRTAIAPRVKT